MAQKVAISAFVKQIESALQRKDGYILGSRGQNPRTGYLDLNVTKCKSSWEPNGWFYTQYSGKQRTQALKWRADCTRVWDCNGMAEGIYEIMTGENIDSKARYNYQQWCDPKGKGTIPASMRVPGAAVFWGKSASDIHHVGYLYKPVKDGETSGDWYIIEARGVMYGVVKTKLSERKPDFWGLMTKYYDYDATNVPVQPTMHHLGDRILRNGDEGEDVRELQTDLIRLDYSCGKWGADGEFGDATEAAVKAFQRDHNLEPDGEFGPKSLAAMEKALVELDTPVIEPREVQIVGGNCYVRTAPRVEPDNILGVAHDGEKLPYQGEISENGWLLVIYRGGNAWVSGKYGKLVSE